MALVTGARKKAHQKERARLEKLAARWEKEAAADEDAEPFELALCRANFRFFAGVSAWALLLSTVLLCAAATLEVFRPGATTYVTTQNGLVEAIPPSQIKE